MTQQFLYIVYCKLYFL